ATWCLTSTPSKPALPPPLAPGTVEIRMEPEPLMPGLTATPSNASVSLPRVMVNVPSRAPRLYVTTGDEDGAVREHPTARTVTLRRAQARRRAAAEPGTRVGILIR